MKTLKKTFLIATLLFAFTVQGSASANAAVIAVPELQNSDTVISREITYLENGDYIETVIREEAANPDGISTMGTMKTKIGSKTKNYKDASGTTLWSLTLKATFTYSGNISGCANVSHSATASASGWSIKSASSTKSGHTATATATATHSISIFSSKDSTLTVTMSCDKNGNIS